MMHEKMEPFIRSLTTRPDKMVRIMRENGIVIDDLDDKMQKMVFTLYTELVAIMNEAKGILEEE